MSDTLGRILKRVAAGPSSGSNLQPAKRALAASPGHLLASDPNHLGHKSAPFTYTHLTLPTKIGWHTQGCARAT